MTSLEYKEKCCPACDAIEIIPGMERGTTQRRRICAIPNHHCHPRPESDWKPALTKLLDDRLVGSAPLEMHLVDFITHHIQQAKDAGWAEHEQEWKNELKEEYQRGLAEGNSQSARLLENNRILQAKLREGNRAILEEVLLHLEEIRVRIEYHREDRGYNMAIADIKEHLENLLSFQQEPQDSVK